MKRRHGLGPFGPCLLMLLILLGSTPSLAGGVQRTAAPSLDAKVRHRSLVTLHSDADAAKLAGRLPAGAKVVDRAGSLAIVESETPVDAAFLAKLRKVPGVAAAQADGIVTKREASCQQAGGNPTGAEAPARAIAADLAPAVGSCRLFDSCPGTERVRLWGQLAVDADLALAEAGRLGLTAGHTRVAVVDSGFDLAGAGPAIAGTGFSVYRGHSEAGDPQTDTDGHGTAVAGLIGATGGIGVAPEARLSVYRVTEASANGTTSDAALWLSIERACNDGNEIINVSWGDLIDESGIHPDEEAQALRILHLGERGCLVVKAAGNSGYRPEHSASLSLDDAYLRVGATTPIGTASDFSTPGEVAAPGSGVFTLASSQVASDERAREGDRCGGQPGRFISGTSFSAPIVAAIAARIAGVLKTGPRYARLAPPVRIRLLNRILSAAQIGGTVNALRAMAIAERWVRGDSPAIPDVAGLIALLTSPSDPACAAEAADCSFSADCLSRRKCVDASRRAVALCQPPAVQTLLGLAATARAHGHLEMASAWLRSARGLGASGTGPVATGLWDDFVARWRSQGPYPGDISLRFGVNFDAATAVVPLVLDGVPPGETGRDIAERALLTWLGSYDSSVRLSSGNASHRDDVSTVIQALAQHFDRFGADATGAFLELLISQRLSKTPGEDGSNLLMCARILAALRDEARFAALGDRLDALEGRIFELLNATNPIQGFHRGADFTPLLERRRTALAAAGVQAAAAGSAGGLGVAQAGYLLAHPETLPAASREAFAWSVLRTSAGGNAWDFPTDQLSRQAIERLEAIALTLPPAARARMRTTLGEIAAGASDPRFLAGLFPFAYGDRASAYTLGEVDSSPLLSPTLLFTTARRLLATFPEQAGAAREVSLLLQNGAFQRTLPYLLADPHPASAGTPAELDVPVYGEVSGSRLEPAPAAGTRRVVSRPIGEALDRFLTYGIDDTIAVRGSAEPHGNFARRSWGLEPVFAVCQNKTALAALPHNGAWRAAAERLLRAAAGDPEAYPESETRELRECLR